MENIYIGFEGFKSWVEVNHERFALRQITSVNEEIRISSRDNCLTEGIVDIENDCEKMSKNEFEQRWNTIMNEYQSKWEYIKKEYEVYKTYEFNTLYYYPQGLIVKNDDTYGCIVGLKDKLKINENVRLKVEGYDDVNQWLILHYN